MKNSKFLRSALIALLCLAILGGVTGGTIAWFTDTVEATNNVIKSGNLDLVVQYYDAATEKWVALEEETKLFNEEGLYEPGYTEVAFLRLANAGTLAFKYDLALTIENIVTGTNVYGEKFELSDYLEIGAVAQQDYKVGDYYMSDYTMYAYQNRSQAIAGVKTDTGMVSLKDKDEVSLPFTQMPGHLLPDETHFIALVLHMPTTIGNEANHLTGTSAPKVQFGLVARATQYTHEEDSFDNQYDKDATFPEIEVEDPNAPKAEVTELTGDQLTIECTNVVGGFDIAAKLQEQLKLPVEVLNGEYTLDFGLTFTAPETVEEVADAEYLDWVVDFELSSSKALSAEDESHIALVGQYPFMDLGDKWIGFEVKGLDVPANEAQRVVKPWDDKLTYEEVCGIGTFKCGVIVDKTFFAGETITLKLCMYEPVEGGEPIKHVVKTVKVGF